MSVTFSALKTRVQNYLGRDDSDIATRVGEFINTRQRIICRSYNFDFMQDTGTGTTTDGTQSYTISDYLPTATDTFADYKEELRVDLRNTDNNERKTFVKLGVMDFERDSNFYDIDEEGEPTHYYIWQSKFFFWPTPDDAYPFRVKGYCYLDDLSASDDNNDITDYYTDVIVYGAVAEGAAYYEDDTKQAKFEKMFRTALGQMIRKQMGRKKANIRQQIKPIRNQATGFTGQTYIDASTDYS